MKKLKFNNAVEAMSAIAQAAAFMDWGIAFRPASSGNPEDPVEGLIVGTDDYLNSLLDESDQGEWDLRTPPAKG